MEGCVAWFHPVSVGRGNIGRFTERIIDGQAGIIGNTRGSMQTATSQNRMIDTGI